MNATSPISEVTFPPYTLTGGVAWREIDRPVEGCGVSFDGGSTWGTIKGGQVSGRVTINGSDPKWREELDPTPDNYRAMQSAWLSHFNVGVGSRVRVVRIPSGSELGWPDVNSYEMTRCRDKIHEVIAIHPQNGIALDCDVWFPFHVLAPVEDDRETVAKCEGCRKEIKEGEPRGTWGDGVVTCEKCSPPILVEEQLKVEVIELTEDTRGDMPEDVRYVVLVDNPKKGDVYPDFYELNEKWWTKVWHCPADGSCTANRGYRFARRAEPHEHPPAVPEGQGKPFTCSDCGRGLIGRVPHTCRGNYRKKVRLTSDPASPTPAIERGEDLLGYRRHNGKSGFGQWRGADEDVPQWVIEKAREERKAGRSEGVIPNGIKLAWEWRLEVANVTTPTPSAGQEGEDSSFLREVAIGINGEFTREFNNTVASRLNVIADRIADKDSELTRLRGEVERLTDLHDDGWKSAYHSLLTSHVEQGKKSLDLYGTVAEKLNEAKAQITTLTADLGRAREENERLTGECMSLWRRKNETYDQSVLNLRRAETAESTIATLTANAKENTSQLARMQEAADELLKRIMDTGCYIPGDIVHMAQGLATRPEDLRPAAKDDEGGGE